MGLFLVPLYDLFGINDTQHGDLFIFPRLGIESLLSTPSMEYDFLMLKTKGQGI